MFTLRSSFTRLSGVFHTINARRSALIACPLPVLLLCAAADLTISKRINSTPETNVSATQLTQGDTPNRNRQSRSGLGSNGNHSSAYQEDYFTHVSSCGWQFLRGQGPFREGYTYQFFPDGTFIWSVVSDYTEIVHGRWDYKPLSSTTALLFIFAQGSGEVLYSKFVPGQKRLLLGGYLLDPIPAQHLHRSPTEDTNHLDIINKANFNNYFLITARPCKRLNMQDDDLVPRFYAFHQDGTFLARYRDGKCEHSGYWSLRKSRLLLEMPQNHCDMRGHANPFNLELEYKVEPTSLAIDHKYKYAPTD